MTGSPPQLPADLAAVVAPPTTQRGGVLQALPARVMQGVTAITAAAVSMPAVAVAVLLRVAEAPLASKVAMAEAGPLALSRVRTWRMRAAAVALGLEVLVLVVQVVAARAAYNPMSRLEHPAL